MGRISLSFKPKTKDTATMSHHIAKTYFDQELPYFGSIATNNTERREDILYESWGLTNQDKNECNIKVTSASQAAAFAFLTECTMGQQWPSWKKWAKW